MTRGNQRELARAKNQKKQADQKKKNADDGLTLEQRRQRDADRLREKQLQKEAAAAGGGGGAAAGGESSSGNKKG